MVARLLRQLQQRARRRQSQPRHVGFAEGEAEDAVDWTGQRSVDGRVETRPRADLILPCSVRSPSLCRMAVSILRVEFPDLLWLFFTPSSHLTMSLMPWI